MSTDLNIPADRKRGGFVVYNFEAEARKAAQAAQEAAVKLAHENAEIAAESSKSEKDAPAQAISSRVFNSVGNGGPVSNSVEGSPGQQAAAILVHVLSSAVGDGHAGAWSGIGEAEWSNTTSEGSSDDRTMAWAGAPTSPSSGVNTSEISAATGDKETRGKGGGAVLTAKDQAESSKLLPCLRHSGQPSRSLNLSGAVPCTHVDDGDNDPARDEGADGARQRPPALPQCAATTGGMVETEDAEEEKAIDINPQSSCSCKKSSSATANSVSPRTTPHSTPAISSMLDSAKQLKSRQNSGFLEWAREPTTDANPTDLKLNVSRDPLAAHRQCEDSVDQRDEAWEEG